MSITFDCPACGKRTRAPDDLAGRKARCPLCQAVIEVPRPPAEDDDPPPEPPPARRPARERLAPTDEAESEERQPCPMCGEMIVANAAKCRFCGEVFDETLRRTERKRRGAARDAELTTGEYVLAFLCSGIGCIVGIVWMIQGRPKGTKMFGISFLMVIVWNVVRFAIETALNR